jgi:hypothetical protein
MTGCVVKVTDKLEMRGVVTGKVWFLIDKDVVIKGDLSPANASRGPARASLVCGLGADLEQRATEQ